MSAIGNHTSEEMEMAQISVIVPVYKVEQYLRKCVDSILSQSFQDFDLILVNDGSPDSCPAICDSYAENDSRITVIHKENGGLSDARNAGIDWAMANSDSRWLAFVDSDDYIHPDYLQTLYSTAIQESSDLIICDFTRVNDTGELIPDDHSFFDLSSEKKTVLFNCLSLTWRIDPAWNKLYAKSLFFNLRFEYGKIHEDEFLIHHILWNCKKAAIISQQLYFYRIRQHSIMATESASSRLDAFEALIQQYEFCIDLSLPTRKQRIYDDCLNSVSCLKASFSPDESRRYLVLRRRYRKAFFSCRSNRTVKGILFFYIRPLYRRLLEMTHKLTKKRFP